MATVLDLGLLESFSFIFPFFLVWAVMYGILEYTRAFGEKRGLHAFIAFCVAMLLLFSRNAMGLITTMIPWFLILFMFIMLMLMAFKFFGVSDNEISSAVKNNRAITYWLVVISIIIVVAALGQTYFSDTSAYVGGGGDTGSGEDNFWLTLFHPKVLGAIFVLIIAVFTMLLLAGAEEKEK